MTLSSQSPRAGMSRQYMYRKRRTRKWPIVLLALLIVGVVGFVIFAPDKQGPPTDEGIAANTADPTRPANNTPPPHAAPERSEGAGTPRNNPTPRAESERSEGAGTDRPITTTPPNPQPPIANDGSPLGQLAQARRLVEQQRLVEARDLLSATLFNPREPMSARLQADVRDLLTTINADLLYGPTAVPSDPIITTHRIESGEYLSTIAPRYGLTADYLAEINGIDNPDRIRLGQVLKVVRGPLNAVVHKRAFLMDLFVTADDGSPVFVESFRVGLGEHDSTPVGMFRVEPGRKAVNPDWRDDRTGQYYASDNPDNPIGEYWLALEGTDDNTAELNGYGIHGTNEPDSIGTMASRGCIRLGDTDIARVFTMLTEGASTVEIRP